MFEVYLETQITTFLFFVFLFYILSASGKIPLLLPFCPLALLPFCPFALLPCLQLNHSLKQKQRFIETKP